MNETHSNPPRLAQALLRMLTKPMDAESIPGDLLEEYREVRFPSLGRTRANVWYIRHVLSMLWQIVWPCVAAVTALQVLSFPLPGGWNPSLLPAPGVSLLHAVILSWAGYYGARRTGRMSPGLLAAAVTSFCGFVTFSIVASVSMPGLVRAPFEKPFIFVIVFVLLSIALTFGVAAGLLGALVGRRFSLRRGA